MNRLSNIAESFSYQYSASRFHLASLKHEEFELKIGSLQKTPHLLGMCLIHGKNSTKCAPGRAARVRRATNSLTAFTPESSSETIGGVSYVTDMIIEAATRRRWLSNVAGWSRSPEASRTASLNCGVLKDSTTDLLRPSWAALRILRHLCGSRQEELNIVRNRRTMAHNSEIQWPSRRREFAQKRCCVGGQSRFRHGGPANLLRPSGC